MSGFSVTVVIPLYNKAGYIRRTLQSVLAQDLAADVIVVDDGSTDRSIAAIADLIGPRVRLIEQANAGPGPARNRGVGEATSDWIAFIDADDLWQPNHLSTLAEVAAAFPKADVVGSGFRRILAGGPLPPTDLASVAPHSLNYLRAARDCEALCSSAIAARRSSLEGQGGFGSVYPGEDIDLWIRLALDHQMAASTRVTSYYVQRTGGLMDRIGEEEAPTQPMFATLAAALADPRHAARHHDLRGLRDHYLANGIKQHLYRGEFALARAQIAECNRGGARVPLNVRLLAQLPNSVVATGIKAKSRIRHRLQGVRKNK